MIILHGVEVVVLGVSALAISRHGAAWLRTLVGAGKCAGVSTGGAIWGAGGRGAASIGPTGATHRHRHTRGIETIRGAAGGGVWCRGGARGPRVTHLVSLLFLGSSFLIQITLSSGTLLGCCTVR